MRRLPTSPEVLAIEEAHRAAQARLGIAGAYLAIRDWNGIAATATVSTGDAWLSRSLQMIRAINRKSVRLAQAYYQLARAIETGYTLGYPEYSSDPKQITMGGLRKQFLNLLLDIADIDKPRTPEADARVPVTDPDELWLEKELGTATQETPVPDAPINFGDTDLETYIEELLAATDSATDDDLVKVDKYVWEDTDRTLDELRDEFAKDLTAAADERAEAIRKIRANEELTVKEAFDKADKLHDAAGSVNAGKVDQAGIQPGRDIINTAIGKDMRVMMWARGTGANPCAFCAMLASRGFAYTSKARASTTKGGSKGDNTGAAMRSYHANCHCYPICRWQDIEDPTAPARTAHYEALWKDKMAGKRFAARGTKNDTLNYWRRLIYTERRAQRLAELAADRK